MIFRKLSSRTCAWILLLLGVLISLGIACWVGSEMGVVTTLVAKDKSIDAVPSIPLETFSLPHALAYGIPVFVIGSVISCLGSELYYAALEFFRENIHK